MSDDEGIPFIKRNYTCPKCNAQNTLMVYDHARGESDLLTELATKEEQIEELMCRLQNYAAHAALDEQELTALKSIVRELLQAAVSGDGPDWFCGFCGNHGHEKLHYDNCITNRPEVKALLASTNS